ncbi:MAG: hypothetical protein HN353_00880 [Bdellovibrionales bacterium]|jgi:hypothetical protein|nr:hypothetical protein [Bdellovibrionales bacterium]MBT3526776.1 hypothetical protein [Bdellovibrionales bacterium]MBT7669838.1 hypothetical protein [Bdellovibrionales bacterium]
MQKVLLLMLLITISLSAFAAEGNPDSWSRYYDRYRNNLTGFMNLSNDQIQNLRPEFSNGIFILFRDYNPTSYNVINRSSFTTRYLPNWHDLIWSADTWMDAVGQMEDYGWDQWWQDNFGFSAGVWTRDNEIDFGAGFCLGYEGDTAYDKTIGHPSDDPYDESPCSDQVVSSTSSSERVKAKKRLRFKLAPIFFFQMDLKNYLISTETYKSNNKSGENTIDLIKGEGGYHKIKQYDYTVGLGVAGNWHYINASNLQRQLNMFVGIAAIKGRSVRSSQLAKSLKEARNLPKLNVPYSADTIKTWNNSDAISYQSKGGVMYLAGIGLRGYIFAGVNYIAEGVWTTFVEKLAADTVYVKITKGKITALSHTAGVGLVSVSTNKFNNADETFSFILNLADADAVKAYEDLVKGNIVPAQKMANAPHDGLGTVVAVRTTTMKQSGRLKSFSFGLPIPIPGIGLSTAVSKGKIFTTGTTHFHPDQSKTDVVYGAYVKSVNSRFFRKHRNRGAVFYGTHYETTQKDGSKVDGYFGQFAWNFDGDYLKLRKVKSAIKKLVKMTGLREEVLVSFSGKNKTKIGYAQISLEASIPQAATDVLMELAADQEKSEVFGATSRAFIKGYFSNGDDINEICSIDTEESTVATCERRFAAQTKKAVRRMKAALKKMRDVKDQSKTDFVKAYGEFGKQLMENQFVFQTVFNLLKGRGIDLDYTLSGTQIPFYKKNFQWLPQVNK